MSSKKVSALLALVALLAGTFLALRAYRRISESKRLAGRAILARTGAERGDAKAEKQLASMYYYGRGVPQNYAEAADWYRKAADQGDAEGEYCLSLMYYEGKGVILDYKTALLWAHKAADQRNQTAEFILGSMYHDGKGVPQDYAEAAHWYQEAADLGDARAEAVVGYLYYNGQGVQQSYEEAARWYRKAADQNDSLSESALGYMYHNGQGVEQDDYEAIRWYRRAAANGDAEALRFITSHDRQRGGHSTWRYVALILLFLAGSSFSVNFLLPGKSIRGWRQLTITALGIATVLFVGLSAYSDTRDAIRYTNELWWAKRVLTAISIPMALSIVLAPRKKSAKTEE